ncbi:MAG: 5'-nucleotidase SurE [candidate division BRC1 bacterium ADurb.BinA364]|nr:MAG: 5'-nucleotidase SurE [candidate division BRC1 bacterium ADurb.BinA364]
MTDRPLILLTNDDGIEAPGLAALAAAMRDLGEIAIVAPRHEMSATGHAISIKRIHSLRPFYRDGALFGHGFEGSPADCVKFAISRFLGRQPDLVVSGINPGPNFGNNIPYSGTVAAALEGAMYGVAAMAVSTGRPDAGASADFGPAARIAVRLARIVLKDGLAPGVALNLNVPLRPESQIKGLRVARQGGFRVIDRFDPIEAGEDGAPCYSNMGFEWVHSAGGDLTDDRAFMQGWAAVTPIQYDLTAREELERWRLLLEHGRIHEPE